ncbi:MAG: hypothetical protein ACP5D2_03430 [Candidatus Nanoarchaeia archaeon]
MADNNTGDIVRELEGYPYPDKDHVKSILEERANGNLSAILDLFWQGWESHLGNHVRVRAKVDGGEPYTTYGRFTGLYFWDNGKLPAGFIIENESQSGETEQEQVYFDRVISVTPYH